MNNSCAYPILFFFFFFFFFFTLTSCTNTEPDYNAKVIDQLVSDLVADKRTVGVAYGIQIGNVTSNTNEFGFNDFEKKTPIQKNAQFRIASLTKPFTATANASKVTIYQLLSHTSGIPNWFEAEMPQDEPQDFPMCKSPHIYIERMGIKSLFEPGTYFSYSNTGYILLGEIIEQVSGQSYFEYLKSHILAPSNMINTEMEFIEQPSPNWIKGYAYNPELGTPFTEPELYHMPFSAGGLRSSIPDLLKFMESVRTGKLISKASYEKMTTYASLKNGQPIFDRLYSPPGQKPKFPSNIKKYGYGLGFQIIENFGTTVISHGGDIAGFNSVLMYIPKNQTTVVILSNTENGILSKLREIEKAATNIELQE
jgi:D-alanyl-D-alanine carboxypeptidase